MSSISCCGLCLSQSVCKLPKILIVCSECKQPIQLNININNNNDNESSGCENCVTVRASLLLSSSLPSSSSTTTKTTSTPLDPSDTNTINTENEGDSSRGINKSIESETQQTFQKFNINNNRDTQVIRAAIDPINIISQLLHSAGLFSRLSLNSVMYLSLTSSVLSKVIRPFINDNLLFRFQEARQFEIYTPKNIKVSSQVDNYPDFVKFIKFEHDFNFAVGTPPAQLTHLYLGWTYNKPLPKLPSTLTHLHFSSYFNQTITSFPPNLVQLELSHHFNKPLPKLPSTLLHLKLGFDYNEPISELPPNLQHFELSYRFTRPLPSLPSSLTYLSIPGDYQQPLKLPSNLLFFEFGGKLSQHFLSTLSQKLTQLILKHFGYYAYKFPHSLKHLSLDYDISQPVVFPPNLITLTLSGKYNHPLNNNSLPQSLQQLSLYGDFNQPLSSLILPNLTDLTIHGKFNRPLLQLPNSITQLRVLTGDFNQRVNGFLPSNLKSLTLIGEFNYPLSDLPQSLEQLELGSNFKQYLQSLPASLTHLTLPNDRFSTDLAKSLPNLVHFSYTHDIHRRRKGSYRLLLSSKFTHFTFHHEPNYDNNLINLQIVFSTKYDAADTHECDSDSEGDNSDVDEDYESDSDEYGY
eukprot:TRINITY_DN151_c0_g1_i3.p1 TRINITY_DN151_c0_g1~~TRINITY_DN151_c0_g1_i3.p1  ORF type:complete len:635 (+),score=68.33 TRINITY_DN151_c0_g1_i3:107-2011(+)